MDEGKKPVEQEEISRKLVELIPRLRRFARVLTDSRDEADDLVQDSLTRGLVCLHQWRRGTRLDSWMFRIVQTVHLNRIRARRKQRWCDIDGVENLISVDPSPRIEARSQLAAVRKAIAGLPEPQRAVLLLVCVEGYKYKEAAGILDIPIGTVMSRLAQARRAVAEKITPMLETATFPDKHGEGTERRSDGLYEIKPCGRKRGYGA